MLLPKGRRMSALKPTRQPLERTSVQLPRQTIEALEAWPTLNRSEALRIVVERYHYLEGISAPQVEKLVEKYRPLFQVALAEMTHSDYKVVARSLPAIVMGAMSEEYVRERVELEHQREPIDWKQVQGEMAALDPIARIYLLDYVVMARHRDEEGSD